MGSDMLTEDAPQPTEQETVEDWRCLQLIEAGMEVSRARRLSRMSHVDLHTAVKLLESGCPEQTAFDIMR